MLLDTYYHNFIYHTNLSLIGKMVLITYPWALGIVHFPGCGQGIRSMRGLIWPLLNWFWQLDVSRQSMTKPHFRKSNDLCCPSTTNPFGSCNLHSRLCLSSTSILGANLGTCAPPCTSRTCNWKIRIVTSISPTPCTAPSACDLQARADFWRNSTVRRRRSSGDGPDRWRRRG